LCDFVHDVRLLKIVNYFTKISKYASKPAHNDKPKIIAATMSLWLSFIVFPLN